MLIAWVVLMVVVAKRIRLDRYSFDIKAYGITYKNKEISTVLISIPGRTRRGIRAFTDANVVIC